MIKMFAQSTLFAVGMLTLQACSFHPSRRVFIDEITVEIQSNPPLTITKANAFEDDGVLCVEGLVQSSEGEHSNQRGLIVVTAFSKTGNKLESTCGTFTSTEMRDGTHLRRGHEHSDRRFDVKLRSNRYDVSKLRVAPLTSSAGCPK